MLEHHDIGQCTHNTLKVLPLTSVHTTAQIGASATQRYVEALGAVERWGRALQAVNRQADNKVLVVEVLPRVEKTLPNRDGRERELQRHPYSVGSDEGRMQSGQATTWSFSPFRNMTAKASASTNLGMARECIVDADLSRPCSDAGNSARLCLSEPFRNNVH